VGIARPDSGDRVRAVQVRPARPAEYDAIGALVVAAYSAGGHLEAADGYAAVLGDVAGRADAHPVLVAERDGELVGSVTLTPPGAPLSKDARPEEYEFRFLGVAQRAWGTGVAEALVAACEEHARAAGARRMVISVIDWNDVGLRLYQRLGYRRVPDRDRRPSPTVVLCALEKDLRD
jgi:ribosomal protein S18 acetylase RimI-like enzyme